MASFHSHRSAKNSLRHDRNLHEIWGLEADYDGERTTPEQLADALRSHHLAGLIVTSPSHRDDAPRARLFLPLSTPIKPAEREHMVDRLAGILPDQLAPESWTQSQSYYIGRVGDAPQHRVIEVDGDFIDLRADLDVTAKPKPPSAKRIVQRKPRRKGNGAAPPEQEVLFAADLPIDVYAELCALGDTAEGIHNALVRLCGRFAAEGMSKRTAIAVLHAAFDSRPADQRDARWEARRAEVPRTVDWAYSTEDEATSGVSVPQAPEVPPSPEPPPQPPPVPPATPPPVPPTAPPAAPAAASGTGQPDPAPAYTVEWLALGFVDQHGTDLRHVAAWSQWLAWNGQVWNRDETLSVFNRVRRHVRQIAAACTKRSVARGLCDARTVPAVERRARSDPRIAATAQQWNRRPRLNTPGGQVDLKTGEVHPHRAEDYATKITAVAPGGECPLWLTFLQQITGGDGALRSYLQRACGYALTADTSEQVLFFLYGSGANGKSVFLGTISGVLGSYATVAAIETFTASPTDQHSCDLAKLHGARVVTAQETADGRRWAESKIKMMTGGDVITARFMRQDFFDFTPVFKLFVAGNHKPGLRSVGEAMRRRVDLIPFAVTIPLPDRDRRLARKLRREWPGILAWMIEGCREWQRIGLAQPPAVVAATEEYLAGEDVLQAWIDECCDEDKARAAYGSVLYSSYRAWAEQAGEFVLNRRLFTSALLDRGFRQGRELRVNAYRHHGIVFGLVLKSHAGTVPP